jgi:hypothetical protein
MTPVQVNTMTGFNEGLKRYGSAADSRVASAEAIRWQTAENGAGLARSPDASRHQFCFVVIWEWQAAAVRRGRVFENITTGEIGDTYHKALIALAHCLRVHLAHSLSKNSKKFFDAGEFSPS